VRVFLLFGRKWLSRKKKGPHRLRLRQQAAKSPYPLPRKRERVKGYPLLIGQPTFPKFPESQRIVVFAVSFAYEDMQHGFVTRGVAVVNPLAAPRHPELAALLDMPAR